jgi:hypothetical protein
MDLRGGMPDLGDPGAPLALPNAPISSGSAVCRGHHDEMVEAGEGGNRRRKQEKGQLKKMPNGRENLGLVLVDGWQVWRFF